MNSTDDSPIRVLQIITRMVRGGAQLVVFELLRGLDSEVFQVELAAGCETGSEGSLWDDLETANIPSHRIPALVRNIKPFTDLRALRQLRQVIRKTKPDIVHAHTSKAGLLGCVAAAREKVPAIVLAPHGHIMAKSAQIPGVPDRGFKRRLLGFLAKHNCRYASVVVAPNDIERQDGIDYGLWREDNSITIPNGIDTEYYVPGSSEEQRQRYNWPKQVPLMGCIARLTREKGIDLAIAALAKLDQAKLDQAELVIVGDGPESGALQKQAEELGVRHRVHFHGLSDRVNEVLRAFDLLVVPSRTEAHGLVAAEALACQIPVVSASAGGLQSMVIHQKTGLCFPPGNVDELTLQIQQTLANPEQAKQLAIAGQLHIEKNFSLHNMLTSTEKLYRQLLNRPRTP